MTKLFETRAIAKDGHLKEDVRLSIYQCLLANDNKPVVVTISMPKKYSTNPQRNYYFGVIVEAIQSYLAGEGKWYDIQTLHESMKEEIGQLFTEEPDPITGAIKKKLRSYNDLSTTEAEIYHTRCRAWAAERGVDIQEPNEGKNVKS